jgi:hypothetical protein
MLAAQDSKDRQQSKKTAMRGGVIEVRIISRDRQLRSFKGISRLLRGPFFLLPVKKAIAAMAAMAASTGSTASGPTR